MAIGWMIKVDVTGDGYKDSVRGYAVAIRNRDEAMAAAREASGERVVEVDGEMTRDGEARNRRNELRGSSKRMRRSSCRPSRTTSRGPKNRAVCYLE